MTQAMQVNLIRWHYLWYVALALVVMIAAITSHHLWFLNFLHVFSGLLWTGIDLFMGFVLGPILRVVELPARKAVLLRLTPRNHDGQYVVHWRIDVSEDCRVDAHEDAFGNITHTFTADGPFATSPWSSTAMGVRFRELVICCPQISASVWSCRKTIRTMRGSAR